MVFWVDLVVGVEVLGYLVAGAGGASLKKCLIKSNSGVRAAAPPAPLISDILIF